MKSLPFILVLLALMVCLPVSGSTLDKVDRSTFPRLRWMGTAPPGTYADYLGRHPINPLDIREVTLPRLPSGPAVVRTEQSLIALVADAGVMEAMGEYVRAYGDILESMGHDVRIFNFAGGTPRDLRALLRNLGGNLTGAVFIGALPAAWYEIDDDFGDGEPAQFPCDLFYMDLDGNWLDLDGDGIYDTHEPGGGDQAPEIFVARIDSSAHEDENRYTRLQDYFARDFRYWNGEVFLIQNGLTYTEDDWAMYADMVNSLVPLYDREYESVTAPNTNRDDYLARLADPVYDIIQLSCHSDSFSHHFTRGERLFYHQVADAPPGALFYNLFACSAARFTEDNFLGGAYLFNDSARALAVTGSTKTGSMLDFAPFYAPLGENRTLGEAFLEWFQSFAPYEFWETCWHYGMVLLGDPMITLAEAPGTYGAPVDFMGEKTQNRSMLIREWVVRLTWTANPANDEPAAGYRLYHLRDQALALEAEIPAGAAEHLIRRVDRDAVFTLALTALAPDGRESPPVFARVE